MADPPFEPNRFFLRAVCFEAMLSVLAGLAGWFVGFQPFHILVRETTAVWPALHGLVWGVVATIPLVLALLLIDRFPFGPLKELQRFTDQWVAPLFAGQRVWQLLILSVAAGLGEEVLFRGLVQGGLAQWMLVPHREWIACLATAILFGLCHWLTPTYALLAGLVGVYLGALYLITDSLIAPMVTHALYDYVALVYFVRWRKG